MPKLITDAHAKTVEVLGKSYGIQYLIDVDVSLMISQCSNEFSKVIIKRTVTFSTKKKKKQLVLIFFLFFFYFNFYFFFFLILIFFFFFFLIKRKTKFFFFLFCFSTN